MVLRSLLLGLRDFVHPKILFFCLIAFVFGWAVWVLLLSLIGGQLLTWFSGWTGYGLNGIAGYATLIFLSFPLILIFGFLFFSLLASAWVQRFLSQRGYQFRLSTGQLGFVFQFTELLKVSMLGTFGWIGGLLLIFVPLATPIVSVLVMTWVQWQILTLDHWGMNQSKENFLNLRKRHQAAGYLLCFILALGSLVPLFNFFLPLYSALCFAHWDGGLRNANN